VNAKVVQQKLATEHPDWKVPERRVNKFLKRHLNSDKNLANADDDATAFSLEPTSPRKRSSIVKPFARLFGRKSSKKNFTPEQAPMVPDVIEQEPEPEPEPVVEELEPVVEEKSLEVLDAYEDDNNPAEKEQCDCTACTIL
jgi:hypothetical protein